MPFCLGIRLDFSGRRNSRTICIRIRAHAWVCAWVFVGVHRSCRRCVCSRSRKGVGARDRALAEYESLVGMIGRRAKGQGPLLRPPTVTLPSLASMLRSHPIPQCQAAHRDRIATASPPSKATLSLVAGRIPQNLTDTRGREDTGSRPFAANACGDSLVGDREGVRSGGKRGEGERGRQTEWQRDK